MNLVTKNCLIGITLYFLTTNLFADTCVPSPSGSVAALRACINRANMTNGDVIDLRGATYTINTPYTPAVADGGAALPDITSQMIIQNGTISRNPSSPYQFRLIHVASTGSLSLEGVTLQNGYDASGSGGGAIFLASSQTSYAVLESVNNSTFQNNTVGYNGNGGAIAANSCASGVIIGSITNSTFSSNSAPHGNGGAISLFPSCAQEFPPAIGLIANSTFTKNSAYTLGGAIVLGGGNLNQLVNSTISGNSISGTQLSRCNGAGIALTMSGSTPSTISNIQSTIVAQNTVPGCQDQKGPDIFVDGSCLITSESTNLIGTNDGNNLAPSPAHGTNPNKSLVGSNDLGLIFPNLGSLKNNGGATQTMALLSNSPAIGAGSNPFALSFDQRGVARENSELVDIGAYQTQPQ